MANDQDSQPRNDSSHADDLATSVFRHYGKALQRYLLRRLQGDAQARDLEQEVYLRLLRVNDAELVRDPQAYMYRIASHVVHEFKQRAQREMVTFDSQAVDEWDDRLPTPAVADPLAEQVASEQEVDDVLAKLPARSRAMVLLHQRDGFSYTEIAHKLHISVHTVKKNMFKAFLILRNSIRAVDRQ